MTDPWGNPLPPDDLPPVDPQPGDFPPVFPPDSSGAPDPTANPAWPGHRETPPAPPAHPSQPPPAWPGHPAPPLPTQYANTPGHPGAPVWTGPKVSVMAIASLICGLLSFLCFGIVLGPVAFGLGLGARRTIAQSNGWRKGDGMAIAGIVLGIIGTILAVITMIYVLRNPDTLNNLFNTTTTSGSGINGA
jgi:hypothetical protein